MDNRKQNLLYLVTSFILAVFLFLYATISNYQSTESSNNQSVSETYTNTISSVQIDVNFDYKKYFASNFTPNVTVQLTSSNRLSLQKESQEATRSFKVTADLTGIQSKSGTHEVPLKVENLSRGVTAALSPETISVKIGKRVKKEFEVEPKVDPSQLAEGVSIASQVPEVTKVEVVTDEDTMSKIAKVVAVLPQDVTLSENYSDSVSLQAVDADGKYQPSTIEPSETNLSIKVKKN